MVVPGLLPHGPHNLDWDDKNVNGHYSAIWCAPQSSDASSYSNFIPIAPLKLCKDSATSLCNLCGNSTPGAFEAGASKWREKAEFTTPLVGLLLDSRR